MERTYKLIELVGISEESYEHAIRNAIEKASQTLHGLSWFEVIEFRGRIKDNQVAEFQVKLKVAFKIIKG
jgi:flavin-binding protein dodecin